MSAMPTPSPQRRNQSPTDATTEIKELACQLFGTRDGVEFWMKHPNPELGGVGDLAYVGTADPHPAGSGAAPRLPPRGKGRPPEDREYARAFGRRRIAAEHAVGRRRSRPSSHANRHQRKGHAARVRAVAGLVNRMLDRPEAA